MTDWAALEENTMEKWVGCVLKTYYGEILEQKSNECKNVKQ